MNLERTLLNDSTVNGSENRQREGKPGSKKQQDVMVSLVDKAVLKGGIIGEPD